MNSIPSGSIVVAADGSADADRAVHWAAEQAFLERRRLIVATVPLQVHPLAAAGVGAAYLYPVEDLLEQARESDAAVAASAAGAQYAGDADPYRKPAEDDDPE